MRVRKSLQDGIRTPMTTPHVYIMVVSHKTLCRMEVLGNLDRTGKAVQQDIARIQDKCYRLQPGGDGEGERSEPVLVSDPPLRAVAQYPS